MSESILMGKIVSAVGIRGEVKIYSYSDDGFLKQKHIYVEKDEYKVEKARMQGNTAVLKLKNVNDRNTAETLIGKNVYIMEEDLEELPEDNYYIRDLIGCKVIDIETSEYIGEVKDVLQYTAQDQLEIKMESGKTFLVPFVKAFAKEVLIREKTIKVALIPGFIEGAIEA
ncbi:MAG: ribosome maturation factor RimM [Clostridia bacterium]|nr:ribosome maturation factor RimM [Clostridia bacterium]